MADLATLKSRIASELHRTDLTTQIASAISTAIRLYRSRRFETNEQQASFSTVASQQSYTTSTIPADIGDIDSVRITVSGRYEVLAPTDFLSMQAETISSTETGVPSEWAWYAQKLHLYPIPNDAYSVLVSYQQRKSEPTGDTDASTIWTGDCEPLIRACAKKIIARDVTYDAEEFSRSQAAEAEALSVLMRESLQLQDEGGLQPNF